MEKIKTKNKFYLVVISTLSALLLLMIILYAFASNDSANNKLTLENYYEKNFYDLVDNINNTEMKLAKLTNATDINYQAKLLQEISKNAYMAQENINNLPYSINGLDNGVEFINQVSGYTETLYKNVNNGKELSAEDNKTLENVYDAILLMKDSLNKISKELWSGYSILNQSLELDGDYNKFTLLLAEGKPVDVDYPTMIYDGPFSDSQINQKVKGLEFEDVSYEKAQENLLAIFTNFNAEMVEYQGETASKFDVYNFEIKNGDQTLAYVQMTKKGGKLLTCSAFNDKTGKNISLKNAEQIALDFVKKSAVNDVEVVWSDIVGDNAFINLAPVENNAIIYPDLIKVKVDLSKGDVLGYEATGYYTNHTQRNIPTPSFGVDKAKAKLPKKFIIEQHKLALIPLDYGKEILCHEFACTSGGDIYYIYINAQNGAEENILKVIQTDNGNLLM